jgi:formylglycine-generating enzyme required for sulfatase activity
VIAGPPAAGATPSDVADAGHARDSGSTGDSSASAVADASTAPVLRATGCPDDMAAIAGGDAREADAGDAGDAGLAAFCIDRYEAPNVRGELPFAQQTAYDGEAWCAARAKRLCTQDEWVRACEGSRGRRFPYGDAHRTSACNDDRPWIEVRWKELAKWPDAAALAEGTRLYQADMSGARAACVSEDGVYDLTGNVAEWVRRSGPPPRPGFDHVLKGCYWAGCYHEPQPNCTFANRAHASSFRTYEAGFRCCADRLAQPVEPGVTSPP